MPIAEPSRRFLGAALIHLVAAGALLAFGPWDQALGVRWGALLWLLLVGFVGFTIIGFALHLFPTFSHQYLAVGTWERATFPIGEGAVIVGTFSLGWPGVGGIPPWSFAIGASLYLLCTTLLFVFFVRVVRRSRLRTAESSPRSGDSVTVPLFFGSWACAVGAGALFVLAGFSAGPGFGWWIAGVHLLVLGHFVLLIVAVSLRLVPRSLSADPPRAVPPILAGLAIGGAVAVPLGMLLTTPGRPTLLEGLALPEAGLALGLLALLGYLGLRARTPRSQLRLHALAVGFFALGGGIGLWMVSRSDYTGVETHAFVNVMGFVGLTILVMWFGMIAPFQRISHTWTARMMWILSATWVLVVSALAVLGRGTAPPPPWLLEIAGGLLLGTAVTWAIGSFPVLDPRLDPLPGISPTRVGEIRDRWRRS